MFIRRSTYHRLVARAEAYHEAYVAARRAENRKAAPAVARRERLVRACASYRAELAANRLTIARKDRRIAQLQGQLDDLLGLNSEQVQAGARWQQRRPDKPYTPVSDSPAAVRK
ncbi:hypothetical protein [Streptomyces sp. A1136]|uniref:hypothetical protein n=1 Tax=Streptomyces sp. A1136 TaxID=2563102 RepID=UPI00109E857A|nr:hypothetical protein [Streptomyces sp. A1136]THA56138.1 hypothetical protein E6R62_12400 [Streptomyces sp. A1136]